MVRVQDIAKAAGVGVGTVSRMINGNGYVSKDKREKIQAAMDELGYVSKKPDQRKIKNCGGHDIGVVVPYASHPFFSKMIQSVEFELLQRGYRCVLFVENGIADRQIEILNMLDNHELDGVINFGNMPYGFEGRKGRPIVAFDRNWGADVPLIRSDHVMGGRMTAEHFLKQGCKKIVQFVGGNYMERSANLRFKECQRILEDNGCEVTNVFAEWDAMSYHYNREMAKRYLGLLRTTDGCFANDIGALSAYINLQSAGVRVPEEYTALPRVMMTTEELQRLTQIQPTVSDIVDRYINEWIINGVTDDNWNSYISELEGAGVNDVIAIYQGAVDRSSK